jgi:voltage-gated sodium channel
MSITPFALIYFLSFVFVIVFTVVNILIGIVLNAMDQAREEDNTKTQQLRVINTIDEDLEGLGSSNPDLSADIDRLQQELALIRKRVSQGG